MFEGIVEAVPNIAPLLVNLSVFLAVLFIGLVVILYIPKYTGGLKKSYDKCAKNRKKIARTLFLVVVGVEIILFLIIYQIDAETQVKPPEKLVIIEIDDFWNLQGGYFERYGYSMDNYEAVIGPIEEHNFSTTLAVSPYIFLEDNQDILALRDDAEMVEYLKQKKEIGHEIAMHGYAHCQNKTYCPEYEENYLNILQGKREIDTIFEQDTVTYLPPGNFWKDPKYYNVIDAGFMITGNTHVDKPYWDGDILITQRGYDVVKRWDWCGAEYEHNDYEDWVRAYQESDFFIIQLHCNTFDSEEKLDDLNRFLDFLEEENVKVVTYKEVYDILREG